MKRTKRKPSSLEWELRDQLSKLEGKFNHEHAQLQCSRERERTTLRECEEDRRKDWETVHKYEVELREVSVEMAKLQERLKWAEESLERERRARSQAMCIAEEAASAAGSVGRLANNLSQLLATLETTVSILNKDLVKR